MIKFDNVKQSNIRTEKDTVGGDTYYVILPREKEERPLCFRQISKDKTMRCTNPAGYKTYHNGTGACLYHGGGSGEKVAISKITTARGSAVMRNRLSADVNRYLQMDRSKLLDLTEQLAYGKVIFDLFVNEYPDPTDDNYGIWLIRFQNLLSTIGTLVEKMSRIEMRSTLTAAQVLYLRATVADILMKYLPDPYDRERAAKELASRLGGEVQETVEMQPSEIYTEVEV